MFDAIVLCGGRASRLGGADKAGVMLGGRTLLDHVLAAVAPAGHVIAVGPERPTERPVIWCREEPAGAGPVAAIAAAVPGTVADTVVVLAADLPWVGPAVAPLIAARRDAAAAVLVDAGGRANYLAAAWDRAALLLALRGLSSVTGASVRSLFRGVTVVEVPDRDGWGADCDTWEDVVIARRRADRKGTDQ